MIETLAHVFNHFPFTPFFFHRFQFCLGLSFFAQSFMQTEPEKPSARMGNRLVNGHFAYWNFDCESPRVPFSDVNRAN